MAGVTLREIAERSGVSVSTVSRILSGDMSRKPSEETASRVLQTAQELGYIESRTKRIRTARPLINLRTVFLSDHESIAMEFFQGILSGIEKEIARLSDEYNISYAVISSSLGSRSIKLIAVLAALARILHSRTDLSR